MSNSDPRPGPGPVAPAGARIEPTFEGVDVAVVLPTLNEELGLRRTLSDLPFDLLMRLRSDAGPLVVRLLVVDGGSTDSTVAIAGDHGIAVLRQDGHGKGQAVRQALDWLNRQRVRYAVVLDADYTYPGSMIPAVVQLLNSGSQLVVGVREPVATTKRTRRDAIHRAGNGLLNLAASQLSGSTILDLCSGFWGVRVDAVPSLHLETSGFEIEAELFMKAHRAGYTVTQIPIPYRERVGVAKLRALRDGARILLTSIRFGRRARAPTAAASSHSLLREILSIVLVHGQDELVLVADDSRKLEAEGLARQLRDSSPDARVTFAAPVSATTPPSADRVRGPGVILTLPHQEPRAERRTAVLELPSTSRVITLGGLSQQAAESAAPGAGPFSRSGGYRLLAVPADGARSAAIRAIFASLLPSEDLKELAFFEANGRNSPMAVWEEVPSDLSTSAVENHHGLPAQRFGSPPEVLVEEGLQ